jgi:hypothetical protein
MRATYRYCYVALPAPSDCSIAGATSAMTATYGPLRDDSVKFSPKVFVN